MSEDLRKLKEKILDYLEKEGFNIFYGREVSTGEPTTEIRWSSEEKDWKDFLMSAKLEGIKTIVFNYTTLTDDAIEAYLQDEEEANEFNKILNSFKNFVGEIGELNLMWIKDGVRYTYSEMSDWWWNFMSLVSPRPEAEFVPGLEKEEEIPEELKTKTAEELAEEIVKFIKKEFPEIHYSMRYTMNLFLEQKGVDRYRLDPETRLRLEKAENLVQQKLGQERLQKERERLPELVEECVKWAKDNSFKKVTKTNVDVFLAEKGVSLSKTIRDILYGRANIILRKEEVG